MTIARRLALLAAVPILVLIALGGFLLYELNQIEKKSRLVAELQVESLAALGNISRNLAEGRVNLRNCLLAGEKEGQVELAKAFRDNSAELNRLLDRYGDALISD